MCWMVTSTSMRNTYGLFGEMLCGLIQVLSCHYPNIGMMAEHKEALLSGKHYSSRNECGVLASKRILLLEIDELSPKFNLR